MLSILGTTTSPAVKLAPPAGVSPRMIARISSADMAGSMGFPRTDFTMLFRLSA